MEHEELFTRLLNDFASSTATTRPRADGKFANARNDVAQCDIEIGYALLRAIIPRSS